MMMIMMNCFMLSLNRINTPRKQGGLGEMKIPLLADKSMKIARDYGVLLEEAGVTFRYESNIEMIVMGCVRNIRTFNLLSEQQT